jgi:capsular polysaccharide biosynthesis protein/MinD-like ATPase involved in chromosome partitioning or flagellar assembly
MHDAQPSLRHYLHVLRRQGWLIVLVVAVALGATALFTFRQDSVYQASMKIVVGQGGIVIGQNGSLFEPALTSDVNRFTATMTNLLKSNVVAQTVIDDLGLQMTPERLLGRLHVTSKPDSSVLEVSYRAGDKRTAVTILGDIGGVFTDLVKERLGAGSAQNTNGQPSVAPVTTSVFDPAHAEPGRVSPRPVRNLAFAGALALLLGLVLAFARESLDDRIRNRREAEEWFGAPVMGSLPKGVRGKSVPELAGDRGRHDQVTEALDLLRANVQFAQAGPEGGTIVVTSALPEDGKSTVVANLGVTLARAGHDVICVEADLHRPMLLHYLGVREGIYGLTDVVAGSVELARALQPVPLPVLSRNGSAAEAASGGSARRPRAGAPDPTQGRLRLLSTGRRPERPSALLGAGRERIVSLMRELSEASSYVLLDTPPLLALADAFPFALAADTVLVVARQGRTTRQNAQAVRATLEGLGAERVAIVLTDVRGGDGYGYYQYGSRTRQSAAT